MDHPRRPERREPDTGAVTPVLPLSEQLLQRIYELEVSHARLKEEMSKLLGCNLPRLEQGPGLDSSGAAQSRQPWHSSNSVKVGRGGTPERARHESSQRGGHRLPPSAHRSHSVSPQRTRMASSRRASFDTRQKMGQNFPQTQHTSPLQHECSSSQFGQKEWSENAFPSELTDRHYINILQSMGQAVYIFKRTGEITYWNRCAELLFGYLASEALGQNAIDLLVDKNNFDMANNIVDRVTMGESWKGQFPLRKKSGELFSAVMSNSPFYDEDGTFVGVICVSTDARPFRDPAGSFTESFDQWKRSNDTVKSKFEQLQIPIASKLSNLAAKVTSKVRSRIRTGENSVEHEGGSGGSQCSDHGYPEFGRMSYEKGVGEAPPNLINKSNPRLKTTRGRHGNSRVTILKTTLCHFAGAPEWRKVLARGYPYTLNAGAMVSTGGDLFEFICGGPLVEKAVEVRDDNIEEWLECGSRVCRLLGFNEHLLTHAQKARVYHYYVPVYLWCHRQLLLHRDRFQDDAQQEIPPIVIGVNAPQGSGKTTLVYTLDHLFNVAGRKAASISIDDFYITAADQAKLAAENAGNTLLELRGNAGSHDLAFGTDTLKTLCSLVKKGTKAKVPRYDKSAFNGRGDRADPSTWPEIEGPLEVIFLEGWMLGFKPLPVDSAKAIDPQLEAVNRNLESYYDAWEKFIGSWIIINVDDPQWVYKWRLQAEITMRAEGKAGMSDEQVADFVSRYMPAYKAYLPGLYSDGPCGSKSEHSLVVKIDEYRNPVG